MKRRISTNGNAVEMNQDIFQMDPSDPEDVEYHALMERIRRLKYPDKPGRVGRGQQKVSLWNPGAFGGMKTLTQLRDELRLLEEKSLTNKEF